MHNSLKNALILIVDESAPNTEFMESVYKEHGAQTITASGGEEALEIIKERPHEIDLTVFDMTMPGLDGVQFTNKVRTTSEIEQTPIILTIEKSANGGNKLELCMEAGANDFVQKPIAADELLLRSRAVLRQRSIRDLQVVELTNEIIGHRDVAMFGWAKIAEYRDPETGGHLKRIQEYTYRLAKRLLSDSSYKDIMESNFAFDIYSASPLHDIGKVGISDNILLKPGHLTTEEFEIMKTHAEKGGKILDEANQRLVGTHLIEMARDIALYHHEKWDGSGYPKGLKGEEIPLCARIMALADVYDALVSKRVYKDAIEHEDVLDIILESSGSHFDPIVVKAFAEISEEFADIKERFKDLS